MTQIIDVRIPDDNEPPRLPDGELGNFFFWLGEEGETDEGEWKDAYD